MILNIRIFFNISDSDVCRIYRESDIVAFISISEGFGMPILEAQASGCVLLCSGIEPMTEIAGEGALFVDPFDVTSVRKGLLLLLSNNDICLSLVKRGYENLYRFNPTRIVEDFISLVHA